MGYALGMLASEKRFLRHSTTCIIKSIFLNQLYENNARLARKIIQHRQNNININDYDVRKNV